MSDSHRPRIAILPDGSKDHLEFHVEPFATGARRKFWDEESFTDALNFIDSIPGIIAGGAARYVLSPRLIPSRADDIDIFVARPVAPQDIRTFFGGRVHRSVAMDQGKPDFTRTVYTAIRQPLHVNIQIIEMDWEYGDHPAILLGRFDFSVARAAIFSTRHAEFGQKRHGIIPDLDKRPVNYRRAFCVYDTYFEQDERDLRLVPQRDRLTAELVPRIWKYVKLGYQLTEESALSLLSVLQTARFPEARLGHAVLTTNRSANDILSEFFQESYQTWRDHSVTSLEGP